MNLLENLLNNKILWLLELEKAKDEEAFIKNLNVMNEELSKVTDNYGKVLPNNPFTTKQTNICKLLTDSDCGHYSDLDQVFNFAVSSGYNPLMLRTNAIYESDRVFDAQTSKVSITVLRKEIQTTEFQEILSQRLRNTKLVKALAGYIEKFGGQKIIDVLNQSGFDILLFAEKNKLDDIINVLPQASEDLKIKVIKGFWNSRRDITPEDLNSLSKPGKDEIISFVKSEIVKSAMNNRVTQTNNYHVSQMLNFAKTNESVLSDEEKGDLLLLIPQDYYYVQMSKALKFKISNCEGVVFASTILKETEKTEKTNDSNEVFHNFTTDTKWLERAVFKNPKFSLKDEYNGVSGLDFLIDFVKNNGGTLSFFKDLTDKHVIRDVGRSTSVNPLNAMKLLQESDELFSLVLDNELRDKKMPGNTFYSSKYFIKNFSKILDKVGEEELFKNVLKDKSRGDSSHKGDAFEILLSLGISIEKKFNKLSVEDIETHVLPLVNSFKAAYTPQNIDVFGIILSTLRDKNLLPNSDDMSFKSPNYDVMYKSFYLHQKMNMAGLDKVNSKGASSDTFEIDTSFKM